MTTRAAAKNDPIRATAEAHLRKCAEAENSGAFLPGSAVHYDDHGVARAATVVSVRRYPNGALQGYVLDVDGFANGVSACAFEVTRGRINRLGSLWRPSARLEPG